MAAPAVLCARFAAASKFSTREADSSEGSGGPSMGSPGCGLGVLGRRACVCMCVWGCRVGGVCTCVHLHASGQVCECV